MGCIGVGAQCDESNVRLLPLPEGQEVQEVARYNAPIQEKIDELTRALQENTDELKAQIIQQRLEKLPEEVRHDLQAALDQEPERRTELQQYLLSRFESLLAVTDQDLIDRIEGFEEEKTEIETKIKDEKAKLKDRPSLRALFDMGGDPTPVRILLRGDYNNPGALVTPGVPRY